MHPFSYAVRVVAFVTLALGPIAYAAGSYLGTEDDGLSYQQADGQVGPGGVVVLPPPDPTMFTRPNVTVEVTPLATADTSSGPVIVGAWDGPVPMVLLPRRQ